MEKNKRFLMKGLIALFTLFITCKGASQGKAVSTQIDDVRIAINRSANYLMKNTKAGGMFEYRINMNHAIKVKEKYNILRHAGAMYAMSMCYQLHPDDNMRSAVKRAGKYLRDEAIDTLPGKENMLAVLSKPHDSQGDEPLQAKLGGTGLGLAALLSLEDISPGSTPLADLRKLGQFLVYMQREDGSFSSKYIPAEGGVNDNWQSLYYPGEAILGLLMLYEKDPSAIWIDSASKALEYLARSRKDKTDVPADHWALLATEKMLSLKNKDKLAVPRELLIDHAVQICDAILKRQINEPERTEYGGGFSMDGRTTPAATCLEGLMAACSFLPRDHDIRKRIDSAVYQGIAFLLNAQIKEGPFAGAFPRSVGRLNQNTPEAKEFNNRATEVRIDYVQHALSAMIQYLRLF
ncbi:MAG: hypothetical protein HW390_702 [Candidatus Brocadiaceae bacterium]|nr:hypothetical protein [Candidatus Brocadiaceae bacterium]